ncbi:PucR family transcriptional regulator [Allosaccharopolyspora coralli]|uniref:PucR family transcriptional regulator n=1 Tax=Allosaccharopolyspora coralli TaxID=2665642 RepID=A0A5Q3QIH7_9PSEU|nr:PucR family transcriptional regulator [Allosaccharopolyspora coralli]QGK70657.1 PucR family transcriptional regulator [Allosaccharopolyspora coralli]
MSISLGAVLAHSSVAPAAPELLAGDASVSVRWVHSSEVLDLAHLLRGGELVLTAGLVLVDSPAARQRRYVRELVARGVAAVAIETSHAVPEPVLEEARRLGFAVVRLTRTVPFVEIAESVNGLLVNESVHRLRLADTLSDELSEHLINGHDLDGLVAHLAARLHASVSVRDVGGGVLAWSGSDAPEGGTLREASITIRHVVSATLVVRATGHTDPVLLDAALDRAPHAVALALMRAHSSEVDTPAVEAFFHALRQPEHAPVSVELLLEATPLAGACSFAVLVMPAGATTAAVEQAACRHGRQVLSRLGPEGLLSVVGLPEQGGQAREALIADVRHVADEDAVRVAVGTLVASAADLPRAVTETRRCLEVGVDDLVVDAARFSVERLVISAGDRAPWEDFVQEHLGPVLALEPVRRERLLNTLIAHVDCAANKTATAKRLHLQRQTLYQRLERLSAVLQQDVATPSPDLGVAVRVFRALQAIRPPVSEQTAERATAPS